MKSFNLLPPPPNRFKIFATINSMYLNKISGGESMIRVHFETGHRLEGEQSWLLNPGVNQQPEQVGVECSQGNNLYKSLLIYLKELQ